MPNIGFYILFMKYSETDIHLLLNGNNRSQEGTKTFRKFSDLYTAYIFVLCYRSKSEV